MDKRYLTNQVFQEIFQPPPRRAPMQSGVDIKPGREEAANDLGSVATATATKSERKRAEAKKSRGRSRT